MGLVGALSLGIPKNLADGVRRVRVSIDLAATEHWLLFSRAISNDKGENIGDVEIAFSLASDGSIEPMGHSLLSVFFPTSVSTGLRFLIQGPYRTTLARDNIPWSDEQNQKLVCENRDAVSRSDGLDSRQPSPKP